MINRCIDFALYASERLLSLAMAALAIVWLHFAAAMFAHALGVDRATSDELPDLQRHAPQRSGQRAFAGLPSAQAAEIVAR